MTPIAWYDPTNGAVSKDKNSIMFTTLGQIVPLVIEPTIDKSAAIRIATALGWEPKREWVGLTPQERDEINEQVYGAVPHHVAFHAAIEAKLKEKNA